jgi:hypothetical protein
MTRLFLCERHAKPRLRLKDLTALRFLNRWALRGPRTDRQERYRAAFFAGAFTGD